MRNPEPNRQSNEISSPFLQVLNGQTLAVPPIWLMRQAGRYLPEYRALRAEAGSFLDLCYNPEMAAEVTLQPIRRYDFDAAILFSDILVIPDALGQTLSFVAGEGPRLAPKLTPESLETLNADDVLTFLAPVFETVRRVKTGLPEGKPLIGFAGAPWTVATYMIAGEGTKDPSANRAFVYQNPEAGKALIALLVDATTEYLAAQIEAGADALQLFDSWASGLPDDLFEELCFLPVLEIARRLKDRYPETPLIAFPRGAGTRLEDFAKTGLFAAVGADTGCSPEWLAQHIQPHTAVQGLLDPLVLIDRGRRQDRAVDRLLDVLGGGPYIFNLGHGITPETPLENVARLVERVRNRGE